MIETAENIADLRSKNPNTYNLIYLKCHTELGDGGGGFFTFVSYQQPDDDGIRINYGTPSTPIIAGNWIRQFNGAIDVRFYGCRGLGNNLIDDAIPIQKAIDYAERSFTYTLYTKGSKVHLPSGTYILKTQLVLKTGVSISGDGFNQTFLKADYTNTFDYMIRTAAGRIEGCTYSDFTIDGDKDTNPNNTETQIRGAIRIVADPGPYMDGGMWNSAFKNIRIRRINGDGIYIAGGQNGNADLTNQLCTFENVYVNRQKDAARSLTLSGCNGQLTFINCGFSGRWYDEVDGTKKAVKGYNVEIKNIFNYDPGNPNNSYSLPTAVVTFLNCSFQEAEYGIYIRSCESITMDNCWFENLDMAVTAVSENGQNCRGINVLNSRFANAASFGSLKVTNKNLNPFGRCITAVEAEMNIYNNYVLVTDLQATGNYSPLDKYFILNASTSDNFGRGIKTLGNSFQDYQLGYSYGIAFNISPQLDGSTYTLDAKDSYLVCVNNDGSTKIISRILSSLNAGEKLTVKALVGSIIFNTTKNISLSGKSTVSLAVGEIAEFVKIDIPAGTIKEMYQLVSVFKSSTPL